MTQQPLDASTRLALQRTRLAQERTLMAWIRTSMSLIAFGFTIYKFFEYLATEERRREPIVSPWVAGMILILVGLVGGGGNASSHAPSLRKHFAVSRRRSPFSAIKYQMTYRLSK